MPGAPVSEVSSHPLCLLAPHSLVGFISLSLVCARGLGCSPVNRHVDCWSWSRGARARGARSRVTSSTGARAAPQQRNSSDVYYLLMLAIFFAWV
jgi:hypothetical protein